MTTVEKRMPWKAALPRRQNWFEQIRVPSRRPNQLENAPPEGEQESANNGSGLERGNEID
jgi:hypothetical protein